MKRHRILINERIDYTFDFEVCVQLIRSLIIYLLAFAFQSILEFDSWLNIDLYHAIDRNDPQLFTPRGNVSVTSINSGSFQLTQQHLSSSERSMIKELAEQNKFYRLKAIVTHSNGAKSTFLTSSKAVCSCYNSASIWFVQANDEICFRCKLFSVCICQFAIEWYSMDFGGLRSECFGYSTYRVRKWR